jgi:hypothetical protein
MLIGSLSLFLGACSSQGNPVPPPALPNKEWVTGKWKNAAEAQFLAGYEFDKDGALKVTFRCMKEAIPGRFAWSSERTVEVVYTKTADVKQAYEAAIKAYKEELQVRIKKREVEGRAGPSLLRLVEDEFPDKHTFTVGITDPKFLVLNPKDGPTLSFERLE